MCVQVFVGFKMLIGVSVPGPGDRVLVLDLADRVTDTTPTAKVGSILNTKG
jgi:hypothetical protein